MLIVEQHLPFIRRVADRFVCCTGRQRSPGDVIQLDAPLLAKWMSLIQRAEVEIPTEILALSRLRQPRDLAKKRRGQHVTSVARYSGWPGGRLDIVGYPARQRQSGLSTA